MFSELIKLRELGRLLRKRRYLEALALARDPAIRDHRKAVVAAEKARNGLLEEAEAQRARGDVPEALQNVRAALRDSEDPRARRLEQELQCALSAPSTRTHGEAPPRAGDDESEQLVWPPSGERTEQVECDHIEPPGRAGLRPVVFRSPDELPGPRTFSRGLPFILRVEERGDWFVHPGRSLLIGNATRRAADLPVLAAVGSRHARIERIMDGHSVHYRVVPLPGHEVTKNRRKVMDLALLEDGDAIGLGTSLRLVFRRPVPTSATAVLELGGDFTVHGCRRVLLFSEAGRAGSIVIGPGPETHVSIPPDGERVELLRGESGETEGVLLARCPRGVAVADGEERPQVRVQDGVPIRSGRLGFFVDPV
ncbi:MAG: hypothetical protein HRU14_04975 [Planctomycetes bacterium]|nr:hypothetical protein [Planctomycetota bacterium]